MTGNNTPGVEAIKWLAFLLMVGDHVARYAVPGLGPVPWLAGRLVFPLFAIALGVGVARRHELRDVVVRLVLWGCLAQAAMMFAVPQVRALNVLFTFAVGSGVVQLARAQGRVVARALGFVALLVASCAVEYGPIGCALIAASIWAARRHVDGARHLPSTVALCAAVVCLWPINGTPVAVLALPVAWALLRWPIELPRVPRLFYRGYVAQWVGVALLAWWVR
jgi:hypothetical protein